MSNFNDYVNYFENLATKHKSILHSEANKRFFRIDLEEFLLGQTNDFDHFSLLLSEYDYRYFDNDDNSQKLRTGTLMFLTPISDENDMEAIDAAYLLAESVCDDFVAKMYEDAAPGKSDFPDDFDPNDCNVSLISNFNGGYGAMLEFTASVRHNLSVDTTKWDE